MKILKKFDSYIKENMETTEEETKLAQTLFTSENDDELSRELEGEDDEEINKSKSDQTEEEDTYIGTQMLNDLAKALGAEVVDGAVVYDGKKINFFSETEKFHVDKKKFATVEEVVDYLTGNESAIGKEIRKTEEEKAKKMIEDESMEDDLLDSDDETVDIIEEEEEEEEVSRRIIGDFEEFDSDVEDEEFENDVDFEGGEFDGFEDEEVSKFMEEDDENFEDMCPSCDCNPCECRDDMMESRITKRFKDFK